MQRSSNPIGVTVLSIHVNSVTPAHPDWRKNTVFFGVEAAGEEVKGHIEGVLTPFGRINQRGHRMVIGDEIERLPLLLKLNRGLHHTEIIAQMQRARRLYAG